MPSGETAMRHNNYQMLWSQELSVMRLIRHSDYLAKAEEAQEIATLFCDESARQEWLKTVEAYRILAGIPGTADKPANDH